jgi:hypothetical protein
MPRRLNAAVCTVVCLVAALVATPAAQSDLDALMSRVLERRDDNWRKLQQYTLNERQTLQVTALAVLRLYGFEREFRWFPREGFFIRSPVKADGVAIDEGKRREAEERWLQESRKRQQRDAERGREKSKPPADDQPLPVSADPAIPGDVEDIVRQSFEPEFIESANFLKFKFDRGQYALAGREQMLDRDVLKIEYYPTLLFRDDPPRQKKEPDARREKREDRFEEQMNKVSLVTLWVDPEAQQILRFEFRNIDMDFLPIPSLIRVDGMRATMQMGEPFAGVWLPASLSMRFRMRLAAGPFEGRYEVKYTDYELPTVRVNVR